MWSFLDAIKFILKSIYNVPKLIEGTTAYSKDFVKELKDFFSCSEDFDMTNGIENILYGQSFCFLGSALIDIIIWVIAGFGGIFSMLFSIAVNGLITAFIMQIMQNHKESWNCLVSKIVCILTIIGIIGTLFGCIGNIFLFSIFGILQLIKKVILVFSYSLILKGLLQ